MTSASEAISSANPSAAPRKPNSYIASPAYDRIFFIFAPLLALGIAQALPLFPFAFERTHSLGGERMRVEFFIGVWTWSHLAAVFFRSHANAEIFALHRYRFTVVPVLLFIGMVSSTWLFVTCTVLAGVWDVYHTSMQNFGIGRIYDAKQGNDARKGRSLDIWMNHVVYIGPVIGGLSPVATIGSFRRFADLGWDEPSRWLIAAETYQPDLRWVLIAAGSLYAAYYVFAYHKLVREGYRISRQKIMLLVSTAVASIYAYGFLPPIEALFVANFFHGLQYFAIVWWTERRNIGRLTGSSSLRVGRWAALAVFGVVLLVLGLGNEAFRNSQVQWLVSLAVLVSLLHFWYDGFVWSVSRKQV